jgi:hypothetical protein
MPNTLQIEGTSISSVAPRCLGTRKRLMMKNEATRTLSELNAKRGVCQVCIRTLDQMDDPRKKEAMDHYKAQLAKIDAEIAEITGKPPPVVVNLKTANLFGESELDKGD